MTFKQYLTTIVILLIGICATSFYYRLQTAAPKAGNFDGGISAMTRSTSVSVGSSSTGVASTSPPRRFLQLQNQSAITVWCTYSGTAAAVGGQGFFLTASSTFSLPYGDGPMYTGALNCIASSTALVNVNEGY